jgi:hypothetical protein
MGGEGGGGELEAPQPDGTRRASAPDIIFAILGSMATRRQKKNYRCSDKESDAFQEGRM